MRGNTLPEYDANSKGENTPRYKKEEKYFESENMYLPQKERNVLVSNNLQNIVSSFFFLVSFII